MRSSQRDELTVLCIFSILVASIFIYSMRPFWAYAVFVASSVFIFAITFREAYGIVQRHSWLIVIYVLALLVALPISVQRSMTAILHFGMAILTIGLAIAITTRPEAWLRASKIAVITFQLIITIFILEMGLGNFPLESLFPGASSNVVTSSLIVLQVNYLAALYIVKNRVATVTTLFTMLLCIVGYGRASMLSAFLLMTLIIIFPLPIKWNLRSTIRRAGLFFITTYAVLFSFGALPTELRISIYTPSFEQGIPAQQDISAQKKQDQIIVSSTKLESGLRDVAREKMLREYIEELDIWSLIVGQPYDGMSIKDRYNGNPHNSYIRAHHIFGLFYGLSIAGITLAAFGRAQPIGIRMFISALILVLLFRGLTETLVFPTVYDVIFFILCFSLLGEKKPQGDAGQAIDASGDIDLKPVVR